MSLFKRLVRFKDYEGKTYYGEAPESLISVAEFIGQEVETYENPFSPTETSSGSNKTKKIIAEILSPIPTAAHIYGIGLNYKGHAAEAGVSYI